MPDYSVKVINYAGEVIAADLPYSSLDFERKYGNPYEYQLARANLTLPWGRVEDTLITLGLRQRIEIYETSTQTGDPIWSGYIKEIVRDMGKGWNLICEEWLGKLASRYFEKDLVLGPDEADDVIKDKILKVYRPVLDGDSQRVYDDFNRASLGADWTSDGNWDISGNRARHVGSSFNLLRWSVGAGAYSFPNSAYTDAKFEFEFEQQGTGLETFALRWMFEGSSWWAASISADPELGYLIQLGPTWETGAQARFGLSSNVVYQFTVIFTDDGATQTADLYLDGEFLFTYSTTTRTNTTGQINFEANGVGAGNIIFVDNFVFWSRQAVLAAGIIDAGIADEIEQEASGKSFLDTLFDILQYKNWYFQITPKAGADLDKIDVRVPASIGSDQSATVVFEEGINLTSLREESPLQDYANLLTVYGEGEGAIQLTSWASRLADLATNDVWEYIETKQEIDDPVKLREHASQGLAQRVSGLRAYTAVVNDARTFRNWSQSDTVAIKCPSLDLDTTMRVVSYKRRAGSDLVELTLNAMPPRLTQEIQNQNILSQFARTQSRQVAPSGYTLYYNLAASGSLSWWLPIAGKRVIKASMWATLNGGSPDITINIDGATVVANRTTNIVEMDVQKWLGTVGTHSVQIINNNVSLSIQVTLHFSWQALV